MANGAIYVGDSRRLNLMIKNIAGRPADPTTLTLRVTKPGLAPDTYTFPDDTVIVKDGVGQYHADILLDTAGAWSYAWTGTGTATFSKGRSFFVRAAA